MGLLTFRGGIHPEEGKSLSKDRPVAPMEAGDTLYFPLSQHIGAPARPLVQKGDSVTRGQMIAEAGGFVSAPVYSSVSGTVTGIRPMRTAQGGSCDCIVVENDGQKTEAEYEKADWNRLEPEAILDRIRSAGIVGMGGAGFPTHVKLAPKDPAQIDTVLVNGAECEPYLTSDYRRMLEEPEQIAEGLRIILKLFPRARGVICVEDNKKDCVRTLKAALRPEDRIDIRLLRTKYPQGAERMLIYAVTGRKINSSMLPADAGCIVDNVDTVTAVYRAVALGEPLMDRILTVTGDAAAAPGNFRVPTGMLFSEVLEAAGGLKQEAEKMIVGGPMMGNAVFGLDIPVTKISSALLALTRDEVSALEPSACINCGRCAEVCPGRVLPARLAVFADHGEEEKFLEYNGMECCECGCCSYVCPAKRQLTQSIKSMRKMILEKRKNQKEKK
jgi:electron transport complex protein RnfC